MTLSVVNVEILRPVDPDKAVMGHTIDDLLAVKYARTKPMIQFKKNAWPHHLDDHLKDAAMCLKMTSKSEHLSLK